MSPILGIWASQNYARYSITGAYDSIATTTVGSGGTSTITFSSIPSTYTHLQLRGIGRGASGETFSNLQIRFNSDTGNNYAYHRLQGNGSSATASATTTTSLIFGPRIADSGSTASIYGAFVIDVLDYVNTNKYKTARLLAGVDTNGGGLIDFMSGLWQSTSAISTITITSNNGTIDQYSHFALYGIKGA